MGSENQTKTLHKVFFPWNEEEEADWLQHMSAQGWHLEKVSFFKYRFIRGKTADFVYRFDFRPMKNKKELGEYTNLFEDAGWQYVSSFSSWHYFRKEKTEGGYSEIFSDNQSKLEKYRRLLLALLVVSNSAIFSPIYILRSINQHPIIWVLFGLLLGLDALLLYMIIRTTKLIRLLKKSPKE